MKNLSISLLFILLFLCSCKKAGNDFPICNDCEFTCIDSSGSDIWSNSCFNNWECEFNVVSQSEVDIEEYLGLTSGDKIAFQMINSNEGDLQIEDDEISYVLVFDIDSSATSFSVDDAGLSDLNTLFRKLCFCGEALFKTVNQGCLQGEKQSDGRWYVQGHLTVPYMNGDQEVKVDALFSN